MASGPSIFDISTDREKPEYPKPNLPPLISNPRNSITVGKISK